jgi:hypothetical protein
MSLKTNYEFVMDNPDPGVPDHMGFGMVLVAAMVEAKQNPTEANLKAARKALQDQIDGKNTLEEAIQERINERHSS